MLLPARIVQIGQDLLGFVVRPRKPFDGRAGSVRVPAQVVVDDEGQPRGYAGSPFAVQAVDGPANDAFSRARVSLPKLRVSAPFDVDDRPLYWATKTVGGGAATYDDDQGVVALTVDGPDDYAARQTRERFVYRAGQSQLVFVTFTGRAPSADAAWRAGYFDDDNGIYLLVDGGGLAVVVRSSVSGAPVDNVVRQAEWNLDRLDGSGPSGFTLDPSMCQILVIDFQALFVGRVRVGFDIDGLLIYVHEFRHANRQAPPYIRHARLPVRYEVESTGGAGALDQVCATVVREGGDDDPGVQRAYSGGITATTTLQTVVGVRLKAAQLNATIRTLATEVLNEGGNTIEALLVLNPPLTGDAVVWKTGTGPESVCELSRSVRSVTVDGDGDVVSAGAVVLSGWNVSGGAGGSPRAVSRQEVGERLPVAAGFDADDRDELWLCVRTKASTSEVLAHLTIDEIR